MHPGKALPSRRSSLVCQEKQTAPPAGVRVLSTTLGTWPPYTVVTLSMKTRVFLTGLQHSEGRTGPHLSLPGGSKGATV